MIYGILSVAFLVTLFYLFVLSGKKEDTPKNDNTPYIDSKPADANLPDFSGSLIRVQSAEELIQTLKLASVIDNIKVHIGLSNENWHKDGLPLIHNFLDLVQRLPASESHHHAGDGGLARHTLDVAAMALKQSSGRSFPPNGKTEDIPRLTPVWKYGILVAALLHDVGKVLTGFNITLSDKDGKNRKSWLPDTGNMPINAYYNVDFLDENHRYTKHAEIGWSFFMTLVPESTRQWIADMSPDLVHLLRSYLSGCHTDSIVEELVKSADMASVSADLATGSRQRFANARRTPLIEIIMDTLQEMLSDRGHYFTIARDAGGDLFRKGDTIYMISKNVPDFIREFLNQNNPNVAKSFPVDNNRIFDTLLEYKAIKPNPFDERKAITNIAVTFQKNDKKTVQTSFTVLAFDAKTLYPDGVYPAEFAGSLEVIEGVRGVSPTPQETSDTGTLKEAPSTQNYQVPPIMAKPQDLPQPKEEIASLESLLDINTANETDTTHEAAISPNEAESSDLESQTESAGNLKNNDTDVSSLDRLLQLSGIFDTDNLNTTTAAENQSIESVSTASISTPQETLSIATKKPASANKKDKKNKLKALFESTDTATTNPEINTDGQPETANRADNLAHQDASSINQDSSPALQIQNDDIERQPEPASTMRDEVSEPASHDPLHGQCPTISETLSVSLNSVIQTNNSQPETVLPRPIPIKSKPSLDNIAQIKQDKRIQQALSSDIDPNTDTFRYHGMKFIHWLANGLANGSISYNTNQSFVHFIENGMLLVTPAVFREFTGEAFNAGNPNCKGVIVQRSFQMLGLIARNQRRSFLYKAFNKNHEPIFSCYLIEDAQLHHLIQMSTRPANNPDLYIISNGENHIHQGVKS